MDVLAVGCAPSISELLRFDTSKASFGCCRAHIQLSDKYFFTFELARTAELWFRNGFGTFQVDGCWMDPFQHSETDVGWLVSAL